MLDRQEGLKERSNSDAGKKTEQEDKGGEDKKKISSIE